MTRPGEQSLAAANDGSQAAAEVPARVPGGRSAVVGLALAAALAVTGAIVLWASLRAGSLGAGIALLRGDSIRVSVSGPVVIGENSDSGSTTVDFTNLSGQPLRIVGYNNPCSCFSVAALPIELPPHEQRSISIKVSASQLDPGELRVQFLTDCPSQTSIPLRLVIQRQQPSDHQQQAASVVK